MLGKLRSLACLVPLTLSPCGCTIPPPVDGAAQAPVGDESYFVIGANPDNAQVFVTRGTMDDGKFDLDGWAKPVYASYPQDGYIVGKVHGTDVFGMTMVSLHTERGSFLTTLYYPCGKTFSFQARPGSVVYLTDVAIAAGGRDGLVPHYREDFAAARAFLAAHYPALADKLEQGRYTLAPVRKCPDGR